MATPTATKKKYVRNRMKTKQSLGVACCRIRNGRPEILLVCKRYTYAYNTFIHGNYDANCISRNDSNIMKLFNGMTIDEKHDINSLNFGQMWYRVWLNTARSQAYYVAKAKFEQTFLLDQGLMLRRLLSRSSSASKLWEIPKGRKKNTKESDVTCAVREFYEGTGFNKKYYKLFLDATRTYQYVDDGVKYNNKYYIAFTNQVITPKINFLGLQEQIDEISDIKWMNIDEIKLVDTTKRLIPNIKPIFNYVKKHCK